MVEELDIAHNTKIYALQLQTLHNSANPDIKQSNQNVILHVLWNVHIIDQNNHTWRGDYDIMLYRAIALQDNCDEPEQAAHTAMLRSHEWYCSVCPIGWSVNKSS